MIGLRAKNATPNASMVEPQHVESADSRKNILLMGFGHALFAAYCILAFAFYRERVLYDTSLFLNTGPLLEGTFFKALDRVTVQVPPQILPLIVVWLGGSSAAAAMAYSLNFALFHYVFWILLAHGYRRPDLGLAYIACILIHLVHNNIFIQADLMHAASYLIVFIAAAQSQPKSAIATRVIRPTIMMLFAFAGCLGHPLMVPLLCFFTVYILLTTRRFDVSVIAAAIIAVALYALNKYGYADFYESGAFEKTLAFSHLRESLRVLPNYLWNAHWPGLFIAAIFAYATTRSLNTSFIAMFAVLLLFALGIAICSWLPLAQHNNWQFSGYTWMYFLAFYIVLLIPIFDRSCAPKRRGISNLRIALVLALGLWMTYGTVLDFHLARERQRFILRVRDALTDVSPPIYLLDGQFSSNSLLRENDLTMWDDSLLVSSYDGPTKACMVITPLAWNDGGGDMYRGRYTRPLNPFYFKIPNAKDNAFAVNTTADVADIMRAATTLTVGYPDQPKGLGYTGGPPDDYKKPFRVTYTIPIHFSNSGGKPFPSRVADEFSESNRAAPIPVTIGYCWVLNDTVIAENKRADNLPIDIRKDFVHNIHVQRDGIPGDAKLTIGLFAGSTFIPCINSQKWPTSR